MLLFYSDDRFIIKIVLSMVYNIGKVSVLWLLF